MADLLEQTDMNERTCSIDGCKGPLRARGWCSAHYRRWQRHGDPLAGGASQRTGCAIPGCSKRHKAYGWCRNHYNFWRRHGHPLGPRGMEPDLPGERWLPIPGLPSYEASDQGRVRSRTQHLKPMPAPSGYLYVMPSINGRNLTRPVHRLVLEAFVGPRPKGMVCRHGPGGYLDNRLVNLCWGTPGENNLDKRRDGTALLGERNHHAKLTDNAVRDIRRRYAMGGVSQGKLAAVYGVSQGVVSKVVRNITWTHVAPS